MPVEKEHENGAAEKRVPKKRVSPENHAEAREDEYEVRCEIRKEISTGRPKVKRTSCSEYIPIGEADAKLKSENHAHEEDNKFFLRQEARFISREEEEYESDCGDRFNRPEKIRKMTC